MYPESERTSERASELRTNPVALTSPLLVLVARQGALRLQSVTCPIGAI